MRVTTLVRVVFFLVALPLSATNWFVTQSGAGSANGTSLGNAWSVANYNASSSPGAGDTVFFSGTLTTAIVPNTSGSSGNLLVLDFSAATLNTSTDPHFNFGTHQFIDVKGGTVTDSGSGLTIFQCSNSGAPQGNIVENWTYHGNTSTGTDEFVQAGFCAMTVQNNIATGMQTGFTNFQGSNNGPTLILNNDFESSSNTSTQTDVITCGDCRNVTIQGNKLVNNAPGNSVNSRHNDVIQTFQSGSSTNQCPTGWIIRYNWIQVAQADGSGGNMSWDELENFCSNPALKFYGNVYVGDATAWAGGNGLSLHTSTAGAVYWFVNNTMYVHAAPLNALRLGEGDGAGTVSLFENNALGSDAGNCGGDCPQVTFTLTKADFNFMQNWDQCGSTFSGTHGSCSTALNFANTTSNNYSLAAASALKNAGDSTVGAEFNQGPCPSATWPNPTLCTRSVGNWDVGAFQTSGIAQVATPTFSPVAGTYPTTQTVTITSATATAVICYTLNGTAPTANGGGVCTNGTTLANGGTVSVASSITVQALGTLSGDTDSAVGSATYTIGIPVASLTPASLSFGGVNNSNTSAPQILTLQNTGTAVMSITSISLTGANTGDFFQSNNCPVGSNLGNGSSCTITVTFTPLAVGSRSASVSVVDGAAGSPHTSSLSGTGVQANFSTQIQGGVRRSGGTVIK